MAKSQDRIIVESKLANALAVLVLWLTAMVACGVAFLGVFTKAPGLTIVAALASAGLVVLGGRLIGRLKHPRMIMIGPEALVVVSGAERRSYDWTRMGKVQVPLLGRGPKPIVFDYDRCPRSIIGNWPMAEGIVSGLIEEARKRFRTPPPG